MPFGVKQSKGKEGAGGDLGVDVDDIFIIGPVIEPKKLFGSRVSLNHDVNMTS